MRWTGALPWVAPMASSPARPGPPEPLFPRLRAGRGLAPERAAAHRRGRLMGAMMEAVRRHGYAETTIAELVALAGVSKSAFYESFASKEGCFLATFVEIVERGAAQAEEAYRTGSGFRGRLLAASRAFADLVAAEPAAASLVLVDSLSLGTAAAEHREQAAARFERMLTQSFAQEPERGEVSELAIRGIVGGARRVLYGCLRSGEPERFAARAEELLDWALAYQRRSAGYVLPASFFASPQPAEGREVASGGGERGPGWGEPPSSAKSRKALSQRERIVRAVARLAARGGYASLSMPAIAAEAGTSNESFYREFASKQEAFFAAFDALATRALRRATPAFQGEREWPAAVGAALAATLSFIAADPLFARLAFFELPAAGPVGLDHADRATQRFMSFLSPEALPDKIQPLPNVVVEAIGGGIWTIIGNEIAHGRAETLPALAPEIADFALVPFGLG